MTIAERASGMFIHITSLPSDFGIGDFGPASYSFVDLLSKSNQQYWNILPLTPTSTKYGNSPYQATSAFAGNTLLISPELLVEDGLLSREYAAKLRRPAGQVDFKAVTATKKAMLEKAFHNFAKCAVSFQDRDFEEFCAQNSGWLDDYALFEALCSRTAKPWYQWQSALRDRDPQVLARKESDLNTFIRIEKFKQYIFFRQWKFLKEYCTIKKVNIVGDLPFYMCYDSSDVWTHPELFKLTTQKRPEFVAGVPPDYFSKTGQLWGNPVYSWRELKKTCFRWWIDRIRNNLKLVDVLRLDHFRGFTAYWQIPAPARTAKRGRWTKASPKNFFAALKSCFPDLPFIAEDLGLITNDVREKLRLLEIPGMRVLLFAFSGSRHNPNLPENHTENSVAFTGTHDTNTVRGWFVEEISNKQKKVVCEYLGERVSEEHIAFEIVKLTLGSKARLSLIPIQDVLALGSDARVNRPARRLHNWEWRVTPEQLASRKIEEFGRMTEDFGRA